MRNEQIMATEQCYCCGNDLDEGFIAINDVPDPATGYRETVYKCFACAEEQIEVFDSYDDDRYAEADRQLTEMQECGF
jgi:hypothetical protein